ncbi:MAG TPA: tetratricopeptide repeat protein [Candidatus Krumholzibacteria bacterium]|nr:tetratricopeptide repeat protein [Candidatus Krumholzibacteria bacterium]
MAAEPPKIGSVETLPREAKLALLDAQQQLEAGQPEKAVEILAQYVNAHAKKDDHYLMRYHYASMLVQADRREDALAQYEKVVALEPRYDAGWLGLGETAYGLGQFKRASEALAQGYRVMTEKRPDVLYYSATAQVLAGDAPGALPVLEELVSGQHGEPKFEWFRGLIGACLQAPNSVVGQKGVDQMLARFGTDPDAWFLAFQFAAGMTDYHQAAVALTVVGYLRPLSRQEQLQLGDLYAAVEAPAAAAGYYSEATQDTASASEVERVASAYLASYQSEEALAILEKGLREHPTFRLWSLLGDLHVMEERYAQAEAAFAECITINPAETRPHLMLAYCMLELDRPDDAMPHLTIAAEDEEWADRAQILIRRAQIMRAAPPAETPAEPGPNPTP